MIQIQRIALLLLFLFSVFGYSQNHQSVDTIVAKYPKSYSSVALLAKQIANDFHTESDKVRAVFFWIANNVSYRPKEYGKYNYSYSEPEDYVKKDKKFVEKISTRAISKGVAVCEGYSLLFTEVCSALGIASKYITGNGKTSYKDIGKPFKSDHAWNIVEIDKKLHLIDLTWAAGTYDSGFQKELDNTFYLTPPEVFFNSHYPDIYAYALIKNKISKTSFANAPLVFDFDFQLIDPLEGVLNKKQKGIKFKFGCSSGSYAVTYDFDLDENILGEIKCKDNTLEFEIDLSNVKRAKSLNLYFDGKLIAEYRLK